MGIDLPEFRLRMTRYAPHTPTAPQAAFLALPHLEALYGGAAGGGKSDALLMGALQYVDVGSYSALLLRRTYGELAMPGGLMYRSHEWLRPTDAAWNGDEARWTFPSGATLGFGHIEHEGSEMRYSSAEFQFVGFDELGTFLESMYRFLFSRLRRLEGVGLPIRMRAASNPGAEWVRSRFVPTPNPITGRLEFPTDPDTGELRVFIPAKLADNPYLDREEYVRTLSMLDPLTRQRLLEGDWNAVPSGGFFRRGWFGILDKLDPAIGYGRPVRRWDLAATPKTEANDPDWTAGAKAVRELSKGGRPILDERMRPAGATVIVDIARTRARSKDVEDLVEQTAELDGREVEIWIEQEPGSSGKARVEYFQRRLRGYYVRGVRTDKKKAIRFGPFASQAEAGMVKLVRGYWNGPFLEEAESFRDPPHTGTHDDMLDAAVGAWEALEVAEAGRTFSG